MEATEKLIEDLLNQIEGAVNGFDSAVPDIQKQIYNKLVSLLKNLETDGDTLKNTVANLNAIGDMKREIEKIVFNPAYESNVTAFLKAFTVVSELNNDYFKALQADFAPGKLLAALKQSAIEFTADQLTESGINAAVIDPVKRMLYTAVTTGGQFMDLIGTLRDNILTDGKDLGTLQRYTRQITTDSINQFSAGYNNTIAMGLGYKWSMYVGSNLMTTRAFCKALTAKKYIYVDELPDILDGHIDGITIPFNPKTGIWYGGIPGTDAVNFPINRGGYQCGHHRYVISEKQVPKTVRVVAYTKFGVEMDEKGLAVNG